MSKAFKVNRPNVVCEAIDGEVVVVSLEKGYYYSLQGTGAELWQGLEKQLSGDSLVDLLEQRYSHNRDELATSVNQFLDQLKREELIVVDSETDLSPTQQADALAATKATLGDVNAGATFALPSIEKFSDMEDLLLLDPIHEVEEGEGWPNAKHA